MSNPPTPPDPKRRSFFRIFTDPEAAAEFGRQAGRALRDLSDALDPPSVPVEQYEAALAQVDALSKQNETLTKQNEALQAAGESSREQLDALFRQGVDLEQQIMAAIEQLRISSSQRDLTELERWRKLRQVLWAALGGAIGVAGKETASALYQAWVQDEMYPDVKELVDRLLRPRLEAPAAPVSPATTPESELEVLAPAEPTEAVRWHVGAPEMIFVPAGLFWMGSDKRRDPQAWDDETPMHKVHVAAYWIGCFPVTVAQFAAFVAATDYQTSGEERGSAIVYTGSVWKSVQGANWRHPRGPQSDVRQKQDHPVTCVTWRDAQAYCAWLSKTSGRLYRLPSEAEWEKAARGTDGRIYPWGDDKPTKELCNFAMNVGDTTPVGAYPKGASPYGVLDMAGNVWDRTSTKWGDSYKNYRPDDSLEGDATRTVRGGSFDYDDGGVRCACRNLSGVNPNGDVGFRVVSPGF